MPTIGTLFSAWQAMVQPESGVLAWLGKPLGLSGPGYGVVAVVLTLSYLWLPYMVLPVFAALERLPDSMLEAAASVTPAWSSITWA